MSLRLKFNLVLGICMLLGILAAGAIAHQLLQKNAREEVMQSATIMMESAMAVRGYTVDEIRPLLAVQQRRQFLSQTVPAYAASRYIEKLQKNHPEYSYKEAALNPTNPANRATDWEAEIITWFQHHPEQTQIVGERETPAGRMLYFGRPIQINNESCLACHGSPSAAPSTFLATYGSANGFGWELTEIIGAQLVNVPMDVPLARAQETFTVFMSALLGVFLLVFLALNVLLHHIVIKPVSTISARATQVSMGALDVPELTIDGSAEIDALAQSFNRMHRSLNNAVKLLDEIEDEFEAA